MKKVTVSVMICFLLSIPSLAICSEDSGPDGDTRYRWQHRQQREYNGDTGNINFFLGYKNVDKDDWEPLDEHQEFGFMLDFKQTDWPISLAIEYFYSDDDDKEFGVDIDGNTTEICFGVRKVWDTSEHVRPFIGGGIAFIRAELEGAVPGFSVSDDDTAMGIWIGFGAYWTLAEHLNIGLLLRWSDAEVTLFNIDGDAGGFHYGLLMGFHW